MVSKDQPASYDFDTNFTTLRYQVRARLYRVPLVYFKYKYWINLNLTLRTPLNSERSKSLQTSLVGLSSSPRPSPPDGSGRRKLILN